MTTALNNLLNAARVAGLGREQTKRFVQAGYTPQAKQLEFHAAARLADQENAPDLIAIGGARGPGKSHVVFAQIAIDDCQRYDGLSVLFLRKVGKAAKESMDKLRQKTISYVPHEFKSNSGTIVFPNNSTIIVGNFQTEADIDKYLGLEYDIIVIEEATQLSEIKITKIRGSLRSSKPGWRPRMYLSTNPGGVGHAWFKRKFVMPWRNGTQEETIFIPANYQDNKFLDKGYIKYLEGLTGLLGRMWRDGDWDVGAGMYFTNWDFDVHVIEPFEIPRTWEMWGSFDYGYSHPTAAFWWAKSDGNKYTVAEHVQPRWLVPQHAQSMHDITASRLIRRKMHQMHGWNAGHDAFAQRGDADAKTIAMQYKEQNIKLLRANINRLTGAAEMLRHLGNPEAQLKPTWYIFNTCVKLIDCIPAMLSDEHRPEDVLKIDADIEGIGGDDPYDGARYGLWGPHRSSRRKKNKRTAAGHAAATM